MSQLVSHAPLADLLDDMTPEQLTSLLNWLYSHELFNRRWIMRFRQLSDLPIESEPRRTIADLTVGEIVARKKR